MEKITTGMFLPDSLIIYLSISVSRLEKCTDLTEEEKAAFLHEYIHYLQAISFPFSLKYFCVSLQIVQLYLNKIALSNEKKFPVPINFIKLANYDENFSNLEIQKCLFDLHFNCNQNEIDDIIEITDVSIKTEDIIFDYIKSLLKHKNDLKGLKENMKYVSISYISCDDYGNELILDAKSIKESMAYLIEKEIFHSKLSHPDFPYKICLYICKKIYPEFSKESWRIVALCEISLLFFNPGVWFYQILTKMKENSYLPRNKDEFISFITRNIFNKNELLEPYPNGMAELKKVIDILYPLIPRVECINKTRLWLHTVLKNMYSFRCSDLLFITNILLSDSPEKYIKGIIEKLHIPPIIGSDNIISNSKDHDYIKSLLVIRAIMDLFDKKEKGKFPFKCLMYNFCKKDESLAFDETICSTQPWNNANGPQKYICLLGVYWLYFSLDGKELYINCE